MTEAAPPYRRLFLTRFLGYLGVAIPLISLAFALAYLGFARGALREVSAVEQRQTLVAAATIGNDLQAVVADLLVMADSTALRNLLREDSPETRQQLGRELRSLLDHKPAYGQIRYLDHTGQEVVRTQRTQNGLELVPAGRLQSKSDRYYFRETIQLPERRIFVSPFDLNVEDGQIENPRQPTIRFAVPISDETGTRRGILVINYLGNQLFASLRTATAETRGQIMLVNADGYWLYTGDPTKEWTFMFPELGSLRFSTEHPAAWEAMMDADDGQYRDASGLFTFATVDPLRASVARLQDQTAVGSARSEGRHAWKIIAHIPTSTLQAISQQSRANLVQLIAIVLSLTLLGCLVAARHGAAHAVATRALAENERRFREMAETIGQVFWIRSAESHGLSYVSPAFTKLWGREIPPVDQLDSLWNNSIHREDQPRVQSYFQVQGQRDEFHIEYRVVQPDDSIVWIRDHGFPVLNQQGDVTHFVGVAEDITRLKKAQEQLLQSERLAAIGETMAGLAHESRNALQRSQACLEMLGKRVQDRAEAVALIHRLQLAQNDLHQLYERVREYAAPIHVHRKPTDVKQLIEQCESDLAERIAERRATIRHTVNTDEFCCDVDPFQLRQVFRNILENALHEELDARAKRECVEVCVEWSDGELNGASALQVTVLDNGPGSELKHLDDIFEPFMTTRARGTGLGMAIARRIIEAHHGRIHATQPVGGGLAFVVLLPRSSVHAFA